MAARPTTGKPQNPRRRRGFERAVTLVGKELRTPAEKRGFAETKLLIHWAEIMGTDIAEMAVPVKVKFGRGFGGTLVLLTTGSKAPLLEMQREAIITRVNACYGYSAIKDVQVTQTAPSGQRWIQFGYCICGGYGWCPAADTRACGREYRAQCQ